MDYFLSNYRQERLISELTGLTMPELLAYEYVEVPDDLEAVDTLLQRSITEFIEHCKEIIEGGNQFQLHTRIACDLLVLRYFVSEIHERDLDFASFTKFNKAIEAANRIAGLTRRLIINDISCKGSC